MLSILNELTFRYDFSLGYLFQHFLTIFNSSSKQINGQVPQVTVAKVGNIQIYLSKDSLNSQLISSESTGMNISVPGPEDEYVEHAIPEQYKTVWNGKGFDTTPTDNI